MLLASRANPDTQTSQEFPWTSLSDTQDIKLNLYSHKTVNAIIWWAKNPTDVSYDKWCYQRKKV